MYVCFKCGIKKPVSEFYAHPSMASGHLKKCKECTREDVSLNYRAKRQHYATYEKTRSMREDRRRAALEYQHKRREANPDMYKAMCAVSNAIRDGRLERKPCEVCGCERVEAHHDDYSKPLEVRWLCRTHHLEVHGKKSYEEFGLNP